MFRYSRLIHNFAAGSFLLMSAGFANAQTSLYLNCTPDQPSRSDRDPIVLVTVSVQGQQWRVSHIAASGVRYDRTQQYSMRDQSQAGAFSWSGTLIDRPYLKMVGLISSSAKGYAYFEHLYDARANDSEVTRTAATCVAVGSGNPLQPSRQSYTIEGVGLGGALVDKPIFSSLTCAASQVFKDANWCQRSVQERSGGRPFTNTIAFLQSGDGKANYLARVIEPAYFSQSEISAEIDRLSRAYGQQAKILNLPPRSGLPMGVIASWGNVSLVPLDDESIRLLANGEKTKSGFIVDFLGDFQRSAQQGLPIYLLSGGPGMIWDANVDAQGKGVLRISAVDTTKLTLINGRQIASQGSETTLSLPAREPPAQAPAAPPWPPLNPTTVAMRMSGGTFVVPVQINGQITLNFTVDSGASDVTIPADVVSTLMRTGTLTSEDFLGSKTYTLADGSTIPSQTFRIRSLTVGDRVLENIVAGASPAAGGLLLGQSFLARFTSWSIDNQRQVLILN
jgi:predicted aspartyl protease